MAKRKHKKKKRPPIYSPKPVAASPSVVEPATTKPAAAAVSSTPDEHAYVKAEVRQTLVVSLILLVFLVGLGILVNQTGFGDRLYELIKL